MFPFGERTKFRNMGGGASSVERRELDVIGLFLSLDQPHHAAVLNQLAWSPSAQRRWEPDGYQLSIYIREKWEYPLAAAVESQHITAPRVDQPGELTFWITIHKDGFFEALHVQATSGQMKKNRLWQVDLTGIQPAYVELTPAPGKVHFDQLAAFLDMDEEALRRWAESSGVMITWNRTGDVPTPGPRDPQYAEFSSLVHIFAVGDRTIVGGEPGEDVELDYDVLWSKDRILVDGEPDPSPDFKSFLISYLGIPAG